MFVRFIVLLALLAPSITLQAQQYVEGYCKNSGVCVQGYFKTRPNETALDNYSSVGNLNPNTGRVSTRIIDIPATSSNVLTDYQLQIGPKGGQFYINNFGKKVYVSR